MSTDYLHTPERACPVLEAMRRGLIDALPERKQALVPAPSGTADDGLTGVRAFMALDWLIRVYLPSFLELSPACREDAERIRALDRIVDLPSAEQAGPVVQQARAAALAAADAAREAAGDAADDAVDDAVMRAVTAAACAAVAAAACAADDAAAAACAAADAAACAADDAADAAACAADDAAADGAIAIAALTTAETARLAAVSGAARRAARAAAAAAAGGVSEDAVRQAAMLAAWDVARAALGPTVESLQDSAIALYADMIDARLRGGAR
jgi:hypothetical protein